MRWLPLWLVPQIATAATLHLVWEFPRSYEPAPSAFVITYTDTNGQALAQMQTPLSAPGACATANPDTFCTQWPTCPPPGVTIFWVRAYWNEALLSEPSDPQVVCLFTVDKPCECQDPATFTAPAQPVRVVVPPLPPTEIPPVLTVTIPAPPPFAPTFPPAPT